MANHSNAAESNETREGHAVGMQHAVPEKKWRVRAGAEVLIWIALPVCFIVVPPLYRHLTEPQPDVEAVRHAMDEIIAAQQRFVEGGFYDADGDGIPDYGGLRQLYNPAGDGSVAPLIGEALVNGRAHGYEFRMYVNPSGGPKRHGYWVVVDPIRRDARWAPVFYLNESGVITTIHGDAPCEDSGKASGEQPPDG